MVNLADNRNIGAISEEEQKILNSKTVFIAGCGGLGCYCADMLSRLGIGHLVLCDCDEFEPSNLNRQLYCNYKTCPLILGCIVCLRPLRAYLYPSSPHCI